MKIIITNVERFFEDEWESAYLSEEGGWWSLEGGELVIYVWKPEYKTDLEQFGCIIHEGFEGLVLTKYNIHKKWLISCIHWFSNILEIICSLGTSPVLKDLSFWIRKKDNTKEGDI